MANVSMLKRTNCVALFIVAILVSTLVFGSFSSNAYASTDTYDAKMTLQAKKSSKKKITKVKLNKTRFVQRDISKKIKPEVTVYSGKKKLSKKYYKTKFYIRYEFHYSGSNNGKSISGVHYSYRKVNEVGVLVGDTRYTTFKIVVKGKNGFKGSVSKTFKVRSGWTVKKPKGWKVGKNCLRYSTMFGGAFQCLDEFEPVYDANGKIIRYETICGRYTVKK